MTGRPPSAADVARRAGVSRTQVSYVLNHSHEGHVSQEHRRRILAAAEELGYRPDPSAQALRRGWSNHFALFFPAPYPARINAMLGTIHEAGLADACVPVQYSFPSYGSPDRRRRVLEAVLDGRPRGVFCSLFDVDEDDVALIRRRGVPHLVLYDIAPHAEVPTLVLPSEQVGFLGAQHLADRGHRRVGLVRPADPVAQRAAGARFLGASRVSGVDLVSLPWPTGEVRPTLAGAHRFLDAHGLPGSGPTGLVCYNDDYALVLLAALADRGVEVPRQLALVGADDGPGAALVRPGLTSVRFDRESWGQRALDLLNAVLVGQDPGVGGRAEPILVPRQTT